MRNLILIITAFCLAVGLAAAQGTASPTGNPPAATDNTAPPAQTTSPSPAPAPAQTTPQTQVPQTDQPAPASGTVLQPANVPETAQGNDVAKGTELRATLDTPLSSKTSKV